ncbi:MAG: hypothetical protein ABUT20_16095 [Bacteroidota bacterium]
MRTVSILLLFFSLISFSCLTPDANSENKQLADSLIVKDTIPGMPNMPDTITADTALFHLRLKAIFHNKPAGAWMPDTSYPLAGAILPYKRIIAYYGNFYSKGMGILGQLPPDEMLVKLREEVKKWEQADSLTPVQPALHYITVTAQGRAGKDKKFRLRMPFHQIDKAIELAKSIEAIIFLDIQVGHSTLQQEIPLLEKYLLMPNVHLGIDPEFAMKGEQVPSGVIGTLDAADINYASEYLSGLVQQYHLPPKILVVHRFTNGMVTNYKKIINHPQVQIVMNMDGFGIAAKKINSYKLAIVNQPVQFTGFKIFYKQDLPKIMEPFEILKLYPQPVYIQYQ